MANILRLAFLTSTLICSVNCQELKCFLGSNVTKLGGTLKIGCKTDNRSICLHDSNTHHAWMQNTTHVAYRGLYKGSFGRYKELIKSCHEMTLLILNFSESDINNKIRCEIKDLNCTFVASKDDIKLKYTPTENDIKISHKTNVTSSSVTASIKKTFPKPNCTFFIEDRNMRHKTTENIVTSGNFHAATYMLGFNRTEFQCPTTITFACENDHGSLLAINRTIHCIILDEILNSAKKAFPNLIVIFIIAIVTFLVGLPIVCSILRNRLLILNLMKDICRRKFWELRRPIVGFIVIVLCGALCLSSWIVTFEDIKNGENTTFNHKSRDLGLAVGSFILMPIVLCFISNPETRSIREGFRKAVDNFMKRVRKYCENKTSAGDNATEEGNSKYDSKSLCGNSTEEGGSENDIIGNYELQELNINFNGR